ncbi:uncharacterized protein [Henckelia pumila]|uniref:uncharacterized protein n=1 Tax=Henckelia pumila TaxID=405737 RepID=UPI003C6DD43D
MVGTGSSSDTGVTQSHVTPSDSSPQITIHKLNGKNYLEWAQLVRLVIDGKDKLGFVNGEVKAPAATDPKYKLWRSENSLVTAWLINSMEPAIGKTFMFLPTAREVWEAVRETYLDSENYSQMYELNTRLWQMQQENKDATTYYNELIVLWQELDLLDVDEWESSKDCTRYKAKCDRQRMFVFLAGLNKDLDEVRGRVLGEKTSAQPSGSVLRGPP